MIGLLVSCPALVLPTSPRVSVARVEAPDMNLAKFAQPAVAAALAAAITLAPIDAAFAAGKSGGRVGGRVSSSTTTRSVAPSASSSSTTRAAGTRVAPPAAPAPPQVTNVYQMAPQPMMGYGGYGYGGYGAPMGGNGLGLFVGLEVAEMFLKEQQRQAYLQQQLKTQQQLGADKAAIESLQRQLAEQNAKVDSLRAQQPPPPPGQAAPAAMSEDQLKLQLQLIQQQKELEMMKQGAVAAK